MTTKAQIDAIFNGLDGQMSAINTINEKVGGSADGLQARKSSLQTQKDDLKNELISLKRETEKYKKSFQEKIFFKPVPVASSLSTLQDFSLAIFAVGWVLLAAVVVGAGIFQPGGSWKRGLILAALMFIITVIIQSLMTSYL
jgi:hypothetical protein